MHSKLLLAIGLCVALACPRLRAADKYYEAVRESVQPYLDDHYSAAITVGIVDENGSHVLGFGQLRQKDPDSRPDGKTVYQVGSITKIFTTTMLAEEVISGRLKLDEPAQKYLPKDLILPKKGNREITLEDLATHHSGLPPLPQLSFAALLGGSLSKNLYAGVDREVLRQYLPLTWLSSPVGEKFNYSNLGIGLIGHALVETSSSESYDSMVRQRITSPLKMNDTGVKLIDEQYSRLVQGYDALEMKTQPWDFPTLEGCGALHSTVNDMLLFAAANLGLRKTVLTPAMELAQTPRPNREFPGGEMGLGWLVQEQKRSGTTHVWHDGMTGGYCSILILIPERKLGVVVLSNVASPVHRIGNSICDLILESAKEGE